MFWEERGHVDIATTVRHPRPMLYKYTDKSTAKYVLVLVFIQLLILNTEILKMLNFYNICIPNPWSIFWQICAVPGTYLLIMLMITIFPAASLDTARPSGQATLVVASFAEDDDDTYMLQSLHVHYQEDRPHVTDISAMITSDSQ